MMAGANLLFLLLSSSHSVLFLMLSLILGGLASGVGLTSMQVSSLATVDPGMSGVASGIFSTFRYFGSIISSALIGMISGYRTLFMILFAVSIIGVFVSLGIKSDETARMEKTQHNTKQPGTTSSRGAGLSFMIRTKRLLRLHGHPLRKGYPIHDVLPHKTLADQNEFLHSNR